MLRLLIGYRYEIVFMNVIAFNPVPHGTFNLDQDQGMSYILTIFTEYSRLGDTIFPAIENQVGQKN